MLRRVTRVPRKLFQYLLKSKQYEGEFFSIKATFGLADTDTSKCVCIVSKKISKKAVARNKIKRQVYSIMYSKLKDSNKNSALRVFPKSAALKENFLNLKKDLETIIHKNNLL